MAVCAAASQDSFGHNPMLWVLLVILLVLVLSDYRKCFTPIPPGPWGLPIVGYMPFLGDYPELTLTALGKEFGHIFSLYVGSNLIIVLDSFELIQEAFVQSTSFNGRPEGPVTKITPEDKGIVSTEGEFWKIHKRFSLRTFRDAGMGKPHFDSKILDEADHLLENFAKFKGEPMDPCDSLSASVANTICLIFCGRRFDYAHENFINMCHLLNEIPKYINTSGLRSVMPWTRFIPFVNKWTGQYEYIKIKERFTEIFKQLIKEHKDAYIEGSRRNYIDAYLTERLKNVTETGSEGYFDEITLTDNLFGLLVAGLVTMVASLRWIILQLMLNPDVQAKVRAEIDEVVGMDRYPSFSDQADMPYTEAVILEVQRYASIVPLNIVHCNPEESTLAGYQIPKRSHVVANFWALDHDPKLWKDPTSFKPERFIKGGMVTKPPYMIPFSIGKRSCLGEHLAKMQLFLFVTSLCQRFNLELSTTEPVCPVLEIGLVRSPKPFKLKAIPRQGYRVKTRM